MIFKLPYFCYNFVMTVTELNQLLMQLPALETTDIEAFEIDIREIRNNMRFENNAWEGEETE